MYDVFIDMDATLNDFTKGYIKYYNRLFNEDVTLKDEDLFEYRISNCVPGVDESISIERRNRIFETPGYWFDIPIKEGAFWAVDWIYKNFNTYILSAPWVDSETCVWEKMQWIKKHLPFFDLNKVVFSSHKHIIHKDSILFDDKPQNLEEFRGKKIAFHYRFNESTKVDGRIHHWDEAQDVLEAYL